MYPTLYHALSDLFGWEIAALKLINSFGLFVALAFVGAAFTLRREIDRKQSLGIFQPTQTTLTIGGPVSWTEYLSQAVVGFILGWKLIYLALNAEVLFQSGLPQRHLFSLEGSPILGLIIAAIFVGWRYWESRKSGKKLSKETVYIPANQHVGGIVTVAAIGVITGAKFFHLLEYPEEMVRFFREQALQNLIGGLTL